MSERENVRVVKVGGSLLSSSRLGYRINQWRVQQPSIPTVWVVGGGKLVDVVRDWQSEQSHVSDSVAHWMSVDLMSVTAKMFATVLGGAWPIESSVESLREQFRKNAQDVIFDCASWLRTVEDLPIAWSVTSDSIAGRLAIELSCQELVLLKSRAASGETVAENVAEGVIDEHFAKLNLRCNVSLVNLSSEDQQSCTILVVLPRT